jgi:hypothetical protein
MRECGGSGSGCRESGSGYAVGRATASGPIAAVVPAGVNPLGDWRNRQLRVPLYDVRRL